MEVRFCVEPNDGEQLDDRLFTQQKLVGQKTAQGQECVKVKRLFSARGDEALSVLIVHKQ